MSCFATLLWASPLSEDTSLAASVPERDRGQRPAPSPSSDLHRHFRPPAPARALPRPQAGRLGRTRPWQPRPPRCPLVPPGRARPGPQAGAGPRTAPAPAPPGHPPSPAAGEARQSSGVGAGEKVYEALFSGCRQGSPLPAPIQTKEAPSPARRPQLHSLRRAPMRRLPSLISSLMNLLVLSSSIS